MLGHVCRLLFFFVITLLTASGCTGFLRKSQGNAEFFTGVAPLPGTYYQVDSRVACPHSNNGTTGYQAVLEVSATKITFRGACDAVPVELPHAAYATLSVSPLGRDSFAADTPLISFQNRILDRMASAPAMITTDRYSTRAWVFNHEGAIWYDVVVRAQGTVESPVNATAKILVSKLDAAGTRSVALLGEIPVFTSSSDSKSRKYSGSNFELVLTQTDGLKGTLTMNLAGSSLALRPVLGNDTFLSPPPLAITYQRTLLAAGGLSSCAVKAGKAYCWGNNVGGQLGTGSELSGGTAQDQFSPAGVVGLSANGSAVTAIAAGPTHACAIQGGIGHCWGANNKGQLGQGSTGSPQNVPGTVINLSQVTAIAAGVDHSCAVNAGKAYCWGAGSSLGLGMGQSDTSSPTFPVSIADDVVSIAAGNSFSCALTVKGDAYCWGDNQKGEVGAGNLTNYFPTPNKITGVRFASLVAFSFRACGITDTGKLYCWGDNTGAVVTGDADLSTYTQVLAPREVPGFTAPVTSASVGGTSACAVQTGQLFCWGENLYGQIGQGVYGSNFPVTKVAALTDVLGVATGDSHALASGLGWLDSWGYNSNGQLGDGTTFGRATPGPFELP